MFLISPPHEHFQRRAQVQRSIARGSGSVRLQKPNSNLFRKREEASGRRIDVRAFTNVLWIDPERLLCETEGMITYEDLVNETLKYGLLPTVVPELKSITIGGALTGIGIESSSFRYGLVHETVAQFDVLLSDGRIINCQPKGEHQDLFFGFANSYGTLGYVLRLQVRLVRATSYVRLEHTRYDSADDYFRALEAVCQKNRKAAPGKCDFVDGTIFSENEQYITTGTFVEQAPATSDYTYMQIYYRSIQQKTTDYLTAHDYIWRWDTDWFWCSRRLHVQNKLLRLFVGRRLLRSTFYWKVLMFTRKYGLLDWLDRIFRPGTTFESVVQDVEIPVERSAEFIDFFHKEVGIEPVWVCPTRAYDPKRSYDLYEMDGRKLYVNFGFWDVVPIPGRHPDGLINRKIEKKVRELGGKKSLYSTSFYGPEEFDSIFNGKRYRKLKQKYDAHGGLKGLFEKTVLRK